MKYDTFTVRYFQNLDLPPLVQENLMGRLNLQLAPLSKAVQYALQISTKQMRECVARQGTPIGNEWKQCEDKCKALITNAVNQEIGSTVFMLKLLANSVIRPDGKAHRLKIGLDESFFEKTKDDTDKGNKSSRSNCRLLTGRWKEDAPFLHLVLPTFKDPEKPTSGRLIMGFGPSASGKTYWAKTILRLLAQADNNFPDVFFAVDGGIVRESSAVYQLATEMAHCAGLAGFKNLHAGMFVTGDIKKTMEQYLLQESQRSTRSQINLYVPETLGKCEFMVKGATVPLIRPCEEYLKTFLDITRDDKWIGLLIWQHATAADHMKDTEFLKEYSNLKYKCAGCMESGKEREKIEGKPYEGHVYAQSMKNGRKYMEMAPGGRYEIHNAGCEKCISIMWDRSVRNPVTEAFSTIMKGDPGITYVDLRSNLYGTPVPMEAYGDTNEGPAVMKLWEERGATQKAAKKVVAEKAAAEKEAANSRAAALFSKQKYGYTNKGLEIVEKETAERATQKAAEKAAAEKAIAEKAIANSKAAALFSKQKYGYTQKANRTLVNLQNPAAQGPLVNEKGNALRNAQRNAQGNAQGNAQRNAQGNAQRNAQGNAQRNAQGKAQGNAQGNAQRNAQHSAKRNAAAAAASIWAHMPSVSEIEETPALRNVALNIEAIDKSGATKRRHARRAAVNHTAVVLSNAAQVARNKTRNAEPQAIMIRQSSDSLNARKKAEKEAMNAQFERQSRGESTSTEPLSEAEKLVYVTERERTAAINAAHDEKSQANLNRKRREALELKLKH